MRLKDKIALITGSARGIGQATAELFNKEGATVLISDIRDKEGQAVAEKLGEGTEYIHLDVRNEDNWTEVADYIKDKYGKIDIEGKIYPLINNFKTLAIFQTYIHSKFKRI